MIDLQKIDEVIDRTGASYPDVRQALLNSDGDVEAAVNALNNDGVYVTEEQTVYEEPVQEQREQKGALASDIMDAIKDIWEKGNASDLIIEKDGKQILNLSLTMSSIALVLAPVAAIIGLGAALITEYTILIKMDDGEVINVNEVALGKIKI